MWAQRTYMQGARGLALGGMGSRAADDDPLLQGHAYLERDTAPAQRAHGMV